jgi:hypothetical protein
MPKVGSYSLKGFRCKAISASLPGSLGCIALVFQKGKVLQLTFL